MSDFHSVMCWQPCVCNSQFFPWYPSVFGVAIYWSLVVMSTNAFLVPVTSGSFCYHPQGDFTALWPADHILVFLLAVHLCLLWDRYCTWVTFTTCASCQQYSCHLTSIINPLAPNDIYTHTHTHTHIRRTAQLTSRRCILNIYSTNILTEYFKHAAHSPFFSFFKMPFIS